MTASPTLDHPAAHAELMGLARLMPLAFQGADLSPLAHQMIQRATRNEADANAWMDLSTLLFLQHQPDAGLATQAQALQMQREYRLPAAHPPALRLLALMAPGDLMTNTPLQFLVENSDIDVTLLYVLPGEPLPARLPAHDVLYVGISELSNTHDTLRALEAASTAWPKPVLNRPAHILRTGRSSAHALLRGTPGLSMPETVRLPRATLQALAHQDIALSSLLQDAELPLIVRPLDSHAGHGLAKIGSLPELQTYLADMPEAEFFVSPFIDYSGPDGLYRKYRVVLVDGQPFAAHMGVSAHWMIHYLNAGMTESEAKRAEEAAFMAGFDHDFGRRHAAALATVAERFGLDYVVIDCAETPQGELLIFELDPGAVVHSMDPVDLFPYKTVPMQKIYAAFRTLLMSTAASPA